MKIIYEILSDLNFIKNPILVFIRMGFLFAFILLNTAI